MEILAIEGEAIPGVKWSKAASINNRKKCVRLDRGKWTDS